MPEAITVAPPPAPAACLDDHDALRLQNLTLRRQILDKEQQDLGREFLAKYRPGATTMHIGEDGRTIVDPRTP